MPSEIEVLPRTYPANIVDQAGAWFWDFLKKELAPYPGRAWIVGRITISATIVMLLVMTFRLPGGFLGAIFTFFLSRENPIATFRAGLHTVVAFLVATVYTAVTIAMFLDEPLTHFLWVVGSLFLAFYLIRILADYGTATGFGFMIAGAIPLWDQTASNVNTRLENTLWTTYAVAIGVAVTVTVEYVFRRFHPASDLNEGIGIRLQIGEGVLRCAAAGRSVDAELDKRLSQYALVGTSRLRRLLSRSDFDEHLTTEINAAVALIGRMIDLASSLRFAMAERTAPIEEQDRERCRHLADYLQVLARNLSLRQPPAEFVPLGTPEHSQLRFLPALEATIALIPKAFAGSAGIEEFIPAPLEGELRQRIFVEDAFSNSAHAKFALRGTLAAMACYATYTAIDWPGLSTSVATCFITALSTIGSSRQKQVLRLGGALIGGVVFGMGAQVFVLPYLDTITGFGLLFALVTGIAAWVSSSSSKLSYLGVQIALAFYLINMQEFTIQISLAIARDRVFGVLLGLVSMWLLFDRLWVRDALDEMQALFGRNLEMFAELAEQLLREDRVAAVVRIRQLRDQINAGFQAVNAQSDAVLFEFGASRRRKLEVREDIRRWQPSIRTLLQVQMTFSQYRLMRPLELLPKTIASAHIAFEREIAVVMRAMANEVKGKTVVAVPDIQASAAELETEVQRYYGDRGLPISTQAGDVMVLTRNLAAILTPLYADIHGTFARPETDAGSYQLGAALAKPS